MMHTYTHTHLPLPHHIGNNIKYNIDDDAVGVDAHCYILVLPRLILFASEYVPSRCFHERYENAGA